MYVDKYLSWNFHVLQLCKKLCRANGILSKLRYYAPLKICLQVYYALFYSHLVYGCNVWGLTSEENLRKLEILQRKCIRIMTFADHRSHTNDLFIELKILKVREIVKLQQLQLLYSFLKNSLPSYLTSLYKLNDEIHTHQTRQFFYVPRVDTSTFGINSIKYHCPVLWNNTWKGGISIDGDRNNNVTFDRVLNINQFKRALKNISYTTTL